MNSKCPVYLDNACFLKNFSNPVFISKVKSLPLEILNQTWNEDCQGDVQSCSFQEKQKVAEEKPKFEAVSKPEVLPNIPETTRVSIHKIDNPYLVKGDVLIYPTNISLQIDDHLIHAVHTMFSRIAQHMHPRLHGLVQMERFCVLNNQQSL